MNYMQLIYDSQSTPITNSSTQSWMAQSRRYFSSLKFSERSSNTSSTAESILPICEIDETGVSQDSAFDFYLCVVPNTAPKFGIDIIAAANALPESERIAFYRQAIDKLQHLLSKFGKSSTPAIADDLNPALG